MRRTVHLLLPVGIVIAATIAACSTHRVLDMPPDPERAIAQYEARLQSRPGDPEALRDLGMMLLRTGQVPRGYEFLTQAYDRNDRDPKTQFFLGVASELVGRPETSVRLYARYTDASRGDPYRRLLQGRYEWLRRMLAQKEMKDLIEREIELGGRFDADGESRTSQGIVAVFPLAYLGSSGRYEPLGRGLAEMISVDLANMPELRVVERARLQVLIDEMDLARSGYLDPVTAPRSGRLLGAGRLIGGTYDISRRNLQVEAGLIDLSGDRESRQTSRSDLLRNLFKMQKEIVFSLLDAMEIDLTPQQREQIEFVPTENLQAFLAYSRGLQEEDRGHFARSADMYRRAASLDPAFEQADVRAEMMEAAAVAAVDADELLSVLTSPVSAGELVDGRHQTMNQSIGAYLFPGGDSRQPTQEARLPLPPAPPVRE
jgi:TolB-like protein